MTDHPMTDDRVADQDELEAEKRRTDIAEAAAKTLYERCERIREERDVFFRQCEYALDRAEKAEAELAERERAAVEDVRPWEPLDGPPRVGDEVRQERVGFTITGVVVRVDGDGYPWAADGIFIGDINEGTWYVRRIPAPTPPAEEVELPTEPCVLTDVRLREALVVGVALWTGLEVAAAGFNGLAAVHPVSDLTAFTLPDGIRARRDGERAGGEPRFVKTQEEA